LSIKKGRAGDGRNEHVDAFEGFEDARLVVVRDWVQGCTTGFEVLERGRIDLQPC
jgi:hypothetical protein